MQKSLSLLLILVLLVSLLFGGVCSALAAGNEVILTLCVQDKEGNTELAGSYTADMLAALTKKVDGAAYVYYKKGAPNAVVATEYVLLDDLLADAAIDFGPAQKLAFECADGPYDKGDFSYEALSQRGVDLDGIAVPAAIALTWGEGILNETTVPGIAARAENTGRLRFVCGLNDEEVEKTDASGSRLPIDIVSITIVSMK